MSSASPEAPNLTLDYIIVPTRERRRPGCCSVQADLTARRIDLIIPEREAHFPLLERLNRPAEYTPEQLARELEKTFAGWADAGPAKTLDWFVDRLRRDRWGPNRDSADAFLTRQESRAYGIPEFQEKPDPQPVPRAFTGPHPLWAVYQPDPADPGRYRAFALTDTEPTNGVQAGKPAIPAELNRPAVLKSIDRHRWKLLRRQGCFNAGPRRLRRRQGRTALGLHPDWGLIGPSPAGAIHQNWRRKEQRDQIRAAFKAAPAAGKTGAQPNALQ